MDLILWTPTLDHAIKTLEVVEMKKVPSKVLINVGLNNIDHDHPSEIIKKGEAAVNLIRRKMPNSNIYINSILYRKDNKFKEEIRETNEHFIKLSRQLENVIFINNANITTNHMFDTKHLNRSGFFTFITNIKYVLFGYLPQFRTRDDPHQRRTQRFTKQNSGYNGFDRQFDKYDH